MFDFSGKRVLVTGAGEGIGVAMCEGFARAGAIVGLNDIDADLAERTAGEINQATGANRVHALACDVSDVDAVYAMVAQFVSNAGGLDVVVANAGITRYLPFLETGVEDFNHISGINLRGTFFTAQAGAKQMIQQGQGGRIILTSSVVGIQTHPNFSVYSMTKAGIRMMAKSLALELGHYGITVNAVSPGATLTPRVLQDDPAYETNWGGVSITGRASTVDDIASATLFLASDVSGQITGQTLVVDGGWTIQSPIPDDARNIPEQ